MKRRKNIGLISICLLLIVSSFVIGSIRGGEFSGADDQIAESVNQVNKDYKPWYKSIWKPPSAEIESLLFAIQAAMGAGFIGYYIGIKKNAKDNTGPFKD